MMDHDNAREFRRAKAPDGVASMFYMHDGCGRVVATVSRRHGEEAWGVHDLVRMSDTVLPSFAEAEKLARKIAK
jgi:hypothetical protein